MNQGSVLDEKCVYKKNTNYGSAFEEKHGCKKNRNQGSAFDEKCGCKKNTNYGSALEEKRGCKKIGTRDQLSMKNVGEDRKGKKNLHEEKRKT